MSETLLQILVFGSVALLIGTLAAFIDDRYFRYRQEVASRLDGLTHSSQSEANASLFKDLKQLSTTAAHGHLSRWARWHEEFEQSGIKLQFRAFLWTAAGLSMCGALAAAVLTQRWWAAGFALVPGICAPVLYVHWRRRSRLRRLAAQLPETFDVLGRAIKAGQTVSAAFQIVADDFEAPICDEFRRCYEEQNLGMPRDTALRNLARRTNIMEMRILVVALLVQARGGGNLGELLNNLATMVRKRTKLEQRVKALTGEGRMQAAVLMVLPVLAFVTILFLSPEYAITLLVRPWLLFGTVVAQLAGALWIRRIVNFEF